MKFARIIDNVAVDVIDRDPVGLFHPALAAEFVIVPADVVVGSMRDAGDWMIPDRESAPRPPEPFRVTKSRFGDLFTDGENATINLIRWQCSQMDAADRAAPANPLVYAETLFVKFGLAEYIELDLPMVADGLALLGMLGVFGDDAEARIPQVLANQHPPTSDVV